MTPEAWVVVVGNGLTETVTVTLADSETEIDMLCDGASHTSSPVWATWVVTSGADSETVPETCAGPDRLTVPEIAAETDCDAASQTRPPVTPDAWVVVVGIEPPPLTLTVPETTTVFGTVAVIVWPGPSHTAAPVTAACVVVAIAVVEKLTPPEIEIVPDTPTVFDIETVPETVVVKFETDTVPLTAGSAERLTVPLTAAEPPSRTISPVAVAPGAAVVYWALASVTETTPEIETVPTTDALTGPLTETVPEIAAETPPLTLTVPETGTLPEMLTVPVIGPTETGMLPAMRTISPVLVGSGCAVVNAAFETLTVPLTAPTLTVPEISTLPEIETVPLTGGAAITLTDPLTVALTAPNTDTGAPTVTVPETGSADVPPIATGSGLVGVTRPPSVPLAPSSILTG